MLFESSTSPQTEKVSSRCPGQRSESVGMALSSNGVQSWLWMVCRWTCVWMISLGIFMCLCLPKITFHFNTLSAPPTMWIIVSSYPSFSSSSLCWLNLLSLVRKSEVSKKCLTLQTKWPLTTSLVQSQFWSVSALIKNKLNNLRVWNKQSECESSLTLPASFCWSIGQCCSQ